MRLVRSVVIVGGGSAGWLAALVLSTNCPFLEIKLVRPKKHVPVGVGESTQTDFLRLLGRARVDVQAFYKACDATMKCGIYYEDWNFPGDHYWHPFSNLALSGSYTAAHHYQQLIVANPQQYTHESYYGAVHTSYAACVKQKRVAPEAALALHVDALKITRYFERHLTGVEVLEADDIDVRTSDGEVGALILDGNRRVTADLYVDCTGFARAIFKRVATPQLMRYQANVNRAVAASVPYADVGKEIMPYTKAHAHENGWTWSIPLQSRIGSGYVYHSDFCSPEQAERSFRAYWGVDRMRDVPVKHIAFDSNTLRNPWEKNVATVGLSAGFIEPLEATGLNWTITSADLLSQFLCLRHYGEEERAKYNASMIGYIRDVQDFVDVHYKLSARRDSDFWRYQTSRPYPERLEARLALYAEEMPSDLNRVKTWPWAFNEVSWLDILNGYRFKYRRLDVHPMQRSQAEEALRRIAAAPRPSVDPRAWAFDAPSTPSPAAAPA